LFREIKEASQVLPSRRNPGEASNRSFVGDRSLRDGAFVWSALRDQFLEPLEEHAYGVRFASKVVLDCPHESSRYPESCVVSTRTDCPIGSVIANEQIGRSGAGGFVEVAVSAMATWSAIWDGSRRSRSIWGGRVD